MIALSRIPAGLVPVAFVPAALISAALIAGLLAFAPPAAAWPVIDVVSSVGGGTPPAVYTTTFTLTYDGPGDRYALVGASRIDGWQVFGCQAPAGWTCDWFVPTPGGASYRWQSGSAPPPALTFAIRTSDPEPCVRFDFLNPFDANGVPKTSDHIEYTVSGCLVVDAPVPARASSWGALKAIYR